MLVAAAFHTEQHLHGMEAEDRLWWAQAQESQGHGSTEGWGSEAGVAGKTFGAQEKGMASFVQRNFLEGRVYWYI